MHAITSQSILNNTKSISFERKYQRTVGYSFPDPVDSFQRTRPRNHSKKPSNLRMKIAALLSAAAVTISGCGGYAIGKETTDKETYLAGFNAGKEQAYAEMQEQNQVGYIDFSQIEGIENYTPQTEQTSLEIPQKVTSLAPDTITELDLTQKPYLYKDDIALPDYFSENNIDLDTLKQAQYNCARVFKSGNYIIISPKQDVTLGEVKRVFGILDEVIGKDPLNEVQTRTHTAGSNGNMDNAILQKDDAIRIKTYNEEKGHQIGVYTAHKSDKSRQKIADEILKWANK